MANYTAMSLKTLFIALGGVMVATLVYTLATDGLPFRKELLTPWMAATLVDFYINITVLAVWICYKESSWLGAVIWILLLVCLGSISTCLFIIIQLFRLSAEESAHDPMYHLLLRHRNQDDLSKKGSFQLTASRVVFSVLGFLMLGVLVFTLLTNGSPFRKDILTPWLVATLIDFYINVAALSVWVYYKESNWIIAITWIVLLICFGSIVTCAYVVWQLLLLSPSDPLERVLLNGRHRAESRYETTRGS